MKGKKKKEEIESLKDEIKIERIDKVILNGIERMEKKWILKKGYGIKNLKMKILRKRGRDEVGVKSIVIKKLRIKEYMVKIKVEEIEDIIIERRKIERKDKLDNEGINGWEVKIRKDDIVSLWSGEGNKKIDMRSGDEISNKRERKRIIIWRLNIENMKVDCEKIKKRRCEGFKKKKSKEKGKKELGKKKGRILKNKEGWKNILEYMNKEVKKSECCEKKGKKFKKEKIRKSEKGN